MEWNQTMMSQWSCVFLQSLCSLLLKFSLCFPLFSPFLKWHQISSFFLIWLKKSFILFFSDSTRLTSRCARHGELSFLPQWVSATSVLKGLDCLTRLPSNFTRHGEQTCASAYFFPLITRHGELGANWGRAIVLLCLFLALGSPWRAVLCISSCFLASKVSRRAFSYKELALDVKSIIEWFFSIFELFAG